MIEHYVHWGPVSGKRYIRHVIFTGLSYGFAITAVSGLQDVFPLDLVIIGIGPAIVRTFGHLHKGLGGQHGGLPTCIKVRENGMEVIDSISYRIEAFILRVPLHAYNTS